MENSLQDLSVLDLSNEKYLDNIWYYDYTFSRDLSTSSDSSELSEELKSLIYGSTDGLQPPFVSLTDGNVLDTTSLSFSGNTTNQDTNDNNDSNNILVSSPKKTMPWATLRPAGYHRSLQVQKDDSSVSVTTTTSLQFKINNCSGNNNGNNPNFVNLDSSQVRTPSPTSQTMESFGPILANPNIGLSPTVNNNVPTTFSTNLLLDFANQPGNMEFSPLKVDPIVFTGLPNFNFNNFDLTPKLPIEKPFALSITNPTTVSGATHMQKYRELLKFFQQEEKKKQTELNDIRSKISKVRDAISKQSSFLSEAHLANKATKKLKLETYEALFDTLLEDNETRKHYLRDKHPEPELKELAGMIYFLYVDKSSRKPPQVGHRFRSYTESHYTSENREQPIICKVKEWAAIEDPTKCWRLYHYYMGNTSRKRKRTGNVNTPNKKKKPSPSGL